LADIIQAGADIQAYTIGMEKEDFFMERMAQDAVIRKLSFVGEAVKRLPSSMKQKEDRVSWKEIAGMRDIMVHDYSDIDLNKVWGVVKKELPELIEAIQRMLKKA
jgi:uncharacterized protein with HEPN domain